MIYSDFHVQLWTLRKYCLVRKSLLYLISIIVSFLTGIICCCSFPKLHSCGCCLLSFLPVFHPYFTTVTTMICLIRLFFTRRLLTLHHLTYSFFFLVVVLVMGEVGSWHLSAEASWNHLFIYLFTFIPLTFNPFIYIYSDHIVRVLTLLFAFKSVFVHKVPKSAIFSNKIIHG